MDGRQSSELGARQLRCRPVSDSRYAFAFDLWYWY